MSNENFTSKFERFIQSLEQDPSNIKVVSYGIAGIGLLLSLYKIKPFTKFRKPNDIPARFLESRLTFKGKLKRVEPGDEVILLVDHKPLLPLLSFSKNTYLPIKPAGVNINNNGVIWLQTVAVDKEINFIPCVQHENYVDCIISISEENEKFFNIGRELVKLGFARVTNDLQTVTDKQLSEYQNSLLSAEKLAARRRNGYWHFAKHPTVVWKSQRFLTEQLKSIFPKILMKQFNL